MSEQQTEQTAYDKIREQKEIRELSAGEHPKTGSFVTLARLKNVSSWKPISFKHAGEEWLVECKQTDVVDNVVTMSNVDTNPEVKAYIEARDELNAKKDVSDEEKKSIRDQMWQELTTEQKTESIRYEQAKANAVLIGAIRFPQEEPPDTYLYLSNEEGDDCVEIQSLDREFIECLHLAYAKANRTEEVIEAVDRFREVGEEEQTEDN